MDNDMPSSFAAFPDIVAGVLGVVLLLWIMIDNEGIGPFDDTSPNIVQVAYKDEEDLILFVELDDGIVYNSKNRTGSDNIDWRDDEASNVIEAGVVSAEVIKIGLGLNAYTGKPPASISKKVKVTGKNQIEVPITLLRSEGYRSLRELN